MKVVAIYVAIYVNDTESRLLVTDAEPRLSN